MLYHHFVRTTLTLDERTDSKLRELAEARHISFKDVVNLALKHGLQRLEAAEASPAYRLEPFDTGLLSTIDPAHLNRLVDELGAGG
jgi:hypothetical protein